MPRGRLYIKRGLRGMAEVEKAIWTAASVAVLREHAWGRSTPAEIAVLVGLSERSVKAKAMKIGLRFTSRLEPGVRQRIAEYAGKGWRITRIARQLNLDPALVALHVPPATLCMAA